MGRKPKPTALKLVEGNPGRRKPNDLEPKPEGAAVCPDWLSPVAREEWEKIAPELDRIGISTSVDSNVLAGYCLAMADLREAEGVLAEDGYTTQTNKGLARHPMSIVKVQALGVLLKFASEFGMTPSSRTKIHARQPDRDGKAGFNFDGP